MGARIKTEQEFIREFGVKWRMVDYGPVDWARPAMDPLFGRTISEETANVIRKAGKYKTPEFGDRWTIYANMIVTTSGDALDMDRFLTWPPMEGHAKWWSGLCSK